VKPRVDSWSRCLALVIARVRAKWPSSTCSSIRAGRTSAWRGSCWAAERWRVRLSLLVGIALCVTSHDLARAAELVQPSEPLVVVISSNPEAPFVRRLAAELSLFGYRVQVAERGDSDADLPGLLARSAAAALIAVDQGRQTVDIVVASSAGPARQERERLDPRRQADTNAAVLAERFRARLTELGIAPGAAAPSDGSGWRARSARPTVAWVSIRTLSSRSGRSPCFGCRPAPLRR
jgi:hypothetical protein